MIDRHGSPLITSEALLARLADPDVAARTRLVDVRWYLNRPGAGRAAFQAGRLPGAVFLDLDDELTAREGAGRHPLPDPVEFTARLAAAGIGDEHVVVAYDDAGAGVAGRLWWMLDALGHRAVTVLDGGIGAWTAAGGTLEAGPPEPRDPAVLTLATAWPDARIIDRDALRGRLGMLRVLDVRAPERYRGEIEPVDRVPGHIPTAINLPIGGNLGADGRFLAPEALRVRFESAVAPTGASGGQTVVSCGSGTNACQAALAMRVAGLPDPVLYPGSYSDWSAALFPIATGEEPGEPA